MLVIPPGDLEAALSSEFCQNVKMYRVDRAREEVSHRNSIEDLVNFQNEIICADYNLYITSTQIKNNYLTI